MTRRILLALCMCLHVLPVLGSGGFVPGAPQAREMVIALRVPADQLGGLAVHRWRTGAHVPVVLPFSPHRHIVGDDIRLRVPCHPGDRIVVLSDKFVSEPVAAAAGGCDGGILRPRIFYAGRAYGQLGSDTGSRLPRRFDVDVARCQVGSVSERTDGVGLFPVALERDGSWKTALPAECLEATIHVETYPPYRVSRVRIPPFSAISWGHITLSRFASLSLDVRGGDGDRPVVGVRACALDPESFAQEALAILRRNAPRSGICGRTDSRGYVTLARIPPGLAHLTIDAAGFAPVVGEPYVLAPGEQAAALVRLQNFATLRVTVAETRQTLLSAFSVRAEPFLAGRPAIEAAVVATPSESGALELRELVPGRWRILLQSALENDLTKVLLERSVEIRAGETEELRFDPDSGTYRGRVLHGGQPVSGSVRLMRVSGSGAILGSSEATADSDGRFEVVLSEPGVYNVSVRSSDRAIAGAVATCRFDNPYEAVIVNLPTAMLLATVVNAVGEPVPSARVDAVPSTLSREVPSGLPAVTLRAVTNEDGVARVLALGDGPWVVRAAEGGRRSEAIETIITDGSPQSVRLILEDTVQLRGRVLSAAGEPLAGVAGHVYFESSAGPGGSGLGSMSTNGRGEFSLNVDPPSATTASIQLFHSLGIAAFRVPASGEVILRMPAQVGSAVVSFTGGSPDAGPNPYHCYLVNDAGAMVGVPIAAAHGLAFGASRGAESTLVLPRLAPGRWKVLRIEYGASPPLFLFSDPSRTRWNGELVVTPGRQTQASVNALAR